MKLRPRVLPIRPPAAHDEARAPSRAKETPVMKIAVLSSLFLLASLPAQDSQAVSLLTTTGDTVRAQVLGVESGVAQLRVFVLGGEMTVKRKLSDFTPESGFTIEELAAKPEGYDAHFSLAKRAGDLRLIGPAGSHARAAVKSVEGAADAESKTNTVRGWAAGMLETITMEAVGRGDLRNAQHYLKLLTTRLPDQRTEEQLEALAAAVDGVKESMEAKQATDRQAKLDAKQRADLDRRMKPIMDRIRQGDRLLRDAIKKANNPSQSARLAEQAIASYKASWKGTQELAEKNADDTDFMAEVQSLTQHMHDEAIRAALHIANVLTIRSDYIGGMEWANKVLAFDPGNAEAKEMVRTIQIAAASASSDWGWGWRTTRSTAGR